MTDVGDVARPSRGEATRTRSGGRLLATGLAAALAASVATAVGAELARGLGVDFAVGEDGETIPTSGIAVVTGFFSLVGVVIAAALHHWSARPARRFVWTTVTLTAASLVPPLVVDTDAGTSATLVALHLVAAAVVITALARALRPT